MSTMSDTGEMRLWPATMLPRSPKTSSEADEMREFEKTAGVRVYTAFSRQPREGRKYAQEEMLAHQDEIWDLIENNASIYLRLRQRPHPGTRGAGRVHPDLRQQDPARPGSPPKSAKPGSPTSAPNTVSWRTSGEGLEQPKTTNHLPASTTVRVASGSANPRRHVMSGQWYSTTRSTGRYSAV